MCYVLCVYEIITISFLHKYEYEKYWNYYNYYYYYFLLGSVVSSKTSKRYVPGATYLGEAYKNTKASK